MRALSLTQPWATLVVTGEKKIETRGWKPSQKMMVEIFDQPIAIHAAAAFPPAARRLNETHRFFGAALSAHGYKDRFHFSDSSRLPLGAIIGTAIFCGVLATEMIIGSDPHQRNALSHFWEGEVTEKEKAFGDYSPNRYGWFLKDARRFEKPIPCKGALSLWEVPRDIEMQIIKNLEA